MATTVTEKPLYTTGDLARLTGNTLRTVRYYEELGLLRPLSRKQGGHRLFTAMDLDRLRTVTDLRALGLTLEETSEVLNLHLNESGAQVSAGKACKLLDEQLKVLHERLETLQRVRAHLSTAREILSHCGTCPDLGREKCNSCDMGNRSKANPLVNILMFGTTRPEAG